MSDYVSEHELALILRLLPVKALLRFRCVSKQWKQLIDSPFFIQHHLSIQTPRFLLQDESFRILVSDPHTPSLHNLNLPFEEHRNMCYYGTHNGLVCLYDSGPSNILVWNPAIRRLTSVYLPKTLNREFRCFGFWIEPSTKEFKFVLLNFMGKNGVVSGIRYSSIKQNWNEIPPEQVVGMNWVPAHQGPPVMVQGVAHWRGYNFKAAGFILAYDFVLQRFDLIQMPGLKSNPFGPTHFRWQGKLSLLHWDRRNPYRFDMYMKMEHGLWVKMLSFDFGVPMSGVFWVLGDESRFKILGRAVFKLVLYDSRDGVIRFIDDDQFHNPRFQYDAYFSYDFVETLLFP